MGRKRQQNRPRYPSGKLKPEVASPAVVRRILNDAIRGASNPLLGSALGRLRLADKIDTEQLSAGAAFAEIVAGWHRVQGLPLPFPKVASYQIGLGRSVGTDAPSHVIENVGKRYKGVMAALDLAGARAKRAVVAVAVLDRSTLDLSALRTGLSRLVDHLHLTKAFR